MKTNFDTARIYSNGQFKNDKHEIDKPNFYCIHLHEAFEAGIEYAQTWISINEELPENKNGFSDLVLAKNEHNDIRLERYDYESGRFTELRYDSQVTDWRPVFFL